MDTKYITYALDGHYYPKYRYLICDMTWVGNVKVWVRVQGGGDQSYRVAAAHLKNIVLFLICDLVWGFKFTKLKA